MADTSHKAQPTITSQQPPSLLTKVDHELTNHHTQTSITILQHILQNHHPEQDHTVLGWGSVAEQKSYYEKSLIEWYKEQRNEKKEAVTPYDSLCLCFTINKNYRDAEEYYAQMAQKYPNNHALLLGFAHTMFNAGRTRQAKEIYQRLLTSPKQKNHAHKQLAVIAFYQDNHQEMQQHLGVIQGTVQSDLMLLFLNAYTQTTAQQQLTHYDRLIGTYPHYVRSYIFKAYTLQSLQRQNQAQQCYLQCIRHSKKYSVPFIQLGLTYLSDHKIQSAIKILQSGQMFKWDDDIMIDFLLSFAHFHQKKYQQAKKYTANLQTAITNKQNSLNDRTRLFLIKFVRNITAVISEDEEDAFESLERYEQLRKWLHRMEELHSIKEEHINMRVDNILRRDREVLKLLLEYLNNSSNELAHNLVDGIERLNIDEDYLVQLANAIIISYSKNTMTAQPTQIQAINQTIYQFYSLLNKPTLIKTHKSSSDQIQIDESMKVYTTKYKPKSYNMLQDKQYFKQYTHLYTVFKVYSKEVKESYKKAELIIQDLFGSMAPTYHLLTSRFDTNDVQMAINEVMMEIFPQFEGKRSHILSQISQTIQHLDVINSAKIVQLINQLCKPQLQSIIKQRYTHQQPTTCYIDDWIDLWLFFDTQPNIIKAIELIKQHCKLNNYPIHNYEGEQYFHSNTQLKMKIKILNVCTTIHLALDRNHGSLMLRNHAQKAVGCRLGAMMKSFIEGERRHKYPLVLYLRQMLEFQQMENADTFHNQKLQSFLQQIDLQQQQQTNTFFDNPPTQKQNLFGSMVTLKKRRLKHLLTMRSQSNMNSAHFKQHSIDHDGSRTRKRSLYDSESYINDMTILNTTQDNLTLKKNIHSFEKKSHNRVGQRFKTDQNEEFSQSKIGMFGEMNRREGQYRKKRWQIRSKQVDVLVNKSNSRQRDQLRQMERVRQQKAEVNIRIKQLQQKLGQSQQQYNSVSKQYNALSKRYNALSKQLQDTTINRQIQHRNRTTQLQQINTHHQQLVDQHIKQIQTLQNNNKQLNNTTQQLHQQISQLHRQYQQQKQEIINSHLTEFTHKDKQWAQQIQTLIHTNGELTRQLELTTNKERQLIIQHQSQLTKYTEILLEGEKYRSKEIDMENLLANTVGQLENSKMQQQYLKAELQHLKLIVNETNHHMRQPIKQQFKTAQNSFDFNDPPATTTPQQKKEESPQAQYKNQSNKVKNSGKHKINVKGLSKAQQQSPQISNHQDKHKSFFIERTLSEFIPQKQYFDQLIQTQEITFDNTQTQHSDQSQQIQNNEQSAPEKEWQLQRKKLVQTTRSLRKKMEYLKVLFLVLFFEAITLTVTKKMLA